MNNFTPGPWYVEGSGGIQMDGIRDGYSISSPTERYVCSLGPRGASDRKQRYADANLIAASPDMREVLGWVPSFLASVIKSGEAWSPACEEALDEVRRVLAKTRGESQ